MRGLTDAARRALDRRLRREHPRPLALALSGGGDSLALLAIADAWAREAGRELLVLTVDHGLNPASGGWTLACRARAEALGRPFRALRWEGEKPAAGLPAAARAARHRLLAEAARDAGAAVILMGHTADDVLEARAMRAAGATTPEPREWAPSPAWPEGRGVFLLRPLLGARRADLREFLSARGEAWIEDPANADPRFARSRARAGVAPEGPVARAEPPPLVLAEALTETFGAFVLPRRLLRQADAAEAARLVAMACVCAGGGGRLPAGERVARAVRAARDEDTFTAVLAGARIEADSTRLLIVREAGEAARGGLAPVALEPGRAMVWDGRFEAVADRPGLVVTRLAGLSARLPESQRRRLAEVPPPARRALPAMLNKAGAVSCPLLEDAPGVRVRALAGERLRAAAGLVEREPA